MKKQEYKFTFKHEMKEGKTKLEEVANADVIKTFVADAVPNMKLRTANITITSDNDGIVFTLINYSTGIALKVYDKDSNGIDGKYKVVLNRKKYSVTTSKIQNMIASYCARHGVVCEEVDYDTFNKIANENN